MVNAAVATGIPTALVAHQGGWDEILLIAGPIVVVVGLLALARRRVTRNRSEQSMHDEPPAVRQSRRRAVNAEELEALDPERVPHGDELTLLTRYLDFYRAVMVRKGQGLSHAQLATRLGPSTLTLGGLIKHLALVEDFWFHERLLGNAPGEPWADVDWDADPDWDFHSAGDDDPAELILMYEQACDRSRAAVVSVGDLEALTNLPNRRGQTFSLRWVLIHMIEETCRHAGHADLLRESIDGTVGD